jgi:apolipoprotein N-acyltransferase
VWGGCICPGSWNKVDSCLGSEAFVVHFFGFGWVGFGLAWLGLRQGSCQSTPVMVCICLAQGVALFGGVALLK